LQRDDILPIKDVDDRLLLFPWLAGNQGEDESKPEDAFHAVIVMQEGEAVTWQGRLLVFVDPRWREMRIA